MAETPSWIEPFIKDGAYIPTREDIEKLITQSREEFELKYLALNSVSPDTTVAGKPLTSDVNLDDLTITKGKITTTYNGSSPQSIIIPNITYGTSAPSGGSAGDVYLRYLA